MINKESRITFTVFAMPGTLFAPGAFGNQIGSDVPIRFDEEVWVGVMADAVVSQDGRSAAITVAFD